MSKIIAFIEAHAEALGLLVIIVVVSFTLAMRERAGRAKADATVKAAQTDIVVLQKQQSAVAKAAKIKVAVLQKEATRVNTPARAVETLTSTSDALIPVEPLKVEVIPGIPDRVSVEALPLYQNLNACAVDRVNLDACTKTLDLQVQITDKKDVQITALKQKPTFWHTVGKFAKVVGCSAAGGAAGSYLKGAQGAAIGAAAGAGVCQLF